MAEQFERLMPEREYVLSTATAYQRMLKENAAGLEPVEETTYRVICRGKNFTIECDHCRWTQIIPDRATYEKLKSKTKHCKSCGARFIGILKN